MRKVVLVLLVALLAVPTGARAEMVSNVISNSTVYQYIFINCANNDCRALFAEVVSPGGQIEAGEALVEPMPRIENLAVVKDAVDPNLNIVENNMPIAEQTIITMVDSIAAASGATDLPVPTEPLNNVTEVSSPAVISNNEGAAVGSSESAVTTAAALNPAPVVNDALAAVERKIVISEIMSAPLVGNAEWVEIENRGAGNVDLAGWTLVEGSGKKTALFGAIQPGNYLMFEKSSLNNSGDVVILKDETGAAVSEVSYGDWNDGNLSDNAPAAKVGNSTALFGEIYKETEVPTPNQENIFQLTVVEPAAVLTSAAAVSVAESSATVSTPSQTVTPVATTPTVVVAPIIAAPPVAVKETAPTFQFSDKIKISEFLADPTGADDGEWIELFNEGDVDVDLFGWTVDDAEGGSKPYKIERHVTIKADDFQVFQKAETLLVLNNSNDEVRLFDPENKLVDKAAYSSVKENHSWAWLNGGWQDASALTPGAANQPAALAVKETDFQVALAAPPSRSGLASLSSRSGLASLSSRSGQFQAEEKAKKTVVKKTKAAIYFVSPAEAVALPLRTAVSVEGRVVAESDVFGKNYFYLDGALVYWSGEGAALAPPRRGDLVRVGGAISESAGEKRIKAKTVEIVGQAADLSAEKITALPLPADKVGRLLAVAGQIVEKKPNKLILADANGEQIVYLKQGADIDAGVYAVGDELTVTGVLSRYHEELRLLPRGKDDIVNLTWQKKEALGLAAVETTVPVGQAKKKVTLALLFTFVALFCLNGYWCWRHREEILKSLKPWWLRVAGGND